MNKEIIIDLNDFRTYRNADKILKLMETCKNYKLIIQNNKIIFNYCENIRIKNILVISNTLDKAITMMKRITKGIKGKQITPSIFIVDDKKYIAKKSDETLEGCIPELIILDGNIPTKDYRKYILPLVKGDMTKIKIM